MAAPVVHLVHHEGRCLLARTPGGSASTENEDLPRSTWPSHEVPMQLHLDFRVDSRDALARHRRRALALGATDLLDCTDEEGESRHVLADPAGHPFCILTQDG